MPTACAASLVTLFRSARVGTGEDAGPSSITLRWYFGSSHSPPVEKPGISLIFPFQPFQRILGRAEYSERHTFAVGYGMGCERCGVQVT